MMIRWDQGPPISIPGGTIWQRSEEKRKSNPAGDGGFQELDGLSWINGKSPANNYI
jgi:hypothetical protein